MNRYIQDPDTGEMVPDLIGPRVRFFEKLGKTLAVAGAILLLIAGWIFGAYREYIIWTR